MKKVLPSLAEVYNLLDQDNSQMGFANTVAPAVFQVSETVTSPSSSPSICYVQSGAHKGKPIFSFCNKIGHIAERCYKKHGFPPGYSKGKGSEKPKTSPVAAQVTMSSSPTSSSANLDGLIGILSKDQIQQFIALFGSQLQSPSTSEASTSNQLADTSGSYQGVDDWSG